jgi:tetratricopeptide (TPR) repeat protein
MKTVGRGTPNRWVKVSSNRAHGAVGQNRSGSFTWAAKQEKFQPQTSLFLLISTFIEHCSVSVLLAVYFLVSTGNAYPITQVERRDANESNTVLAEKLALAARSKGDLHRALDILLDALKDNPKDPRLLLDVGTVELEMGLSLDALKSFQQARELQPADLQNLYGLARAELALQNMPAAERDMRQYLAQRNDDATAHFGLGRVLQMLERTDEAKKEFQRSIELQPNQTESYYELGDIALNDSDYPLAESQYQKVLHHNPAHAGALTGLGIAAYRQEQFAEAEAYLQSAVKYAPDYQPARYYYGLTLKRLGKLVESERELKIALDLDAKTKDAQTKAPKGLRPPTIESPSTKVAPQ